ncbi:MAG: A/G-specific adenine glycosylase [Proteobacteria bacterium]|nr:A/G-specific adenine glycosylase [Pseudomonadota bacterium]
MTAFAQTLIAWQRRFGRRDLPWQESPDPYRVWLSEIMLQQTQVSAVVPYYRRFTASFPDLGALARAPLERVLAHWSGLGYYARARNLHRAARQLVAEGGNFPETATALAALPGIGRSTAAAIAAFAFGRREAILDGNVKRVLARVFGIAGWPGARDIEAALWQQAEALLPRRGIQTYTQALMDLGATVCTRTAPRCERCPVADRCIARREGRTQELPGRRPRRALALREATWLVATQGDRVLLVKNPLQGLWGGLWVFPVSAGRNAAADASRLLGAGTRARVSRPVLEHVFTHFRLRARLVLCAPSAAVEPGTPQGGRWFTFAGALRAALPTPVRAVIADLVKCASAPETRPLRRARDAASPGVPVRRRTRAAAG